MATLNPSNITDGNTIEPTDILQLYDALTSGGGTTGAYNVTVSGSLIGNASTSTSSSFATSASRAVSSSFATTASYAANGGTANQVIQQQSERLSGGVLEVTFKFICGSAQATGGVATTSAYSLLSGKTLGTNVFVTATINANSPTSGNIVVVKSLSGGALTFNTAGGTGTETIFYQASIIQ
jgi:hypothetical protein